VLDDRTRRISLELDKEAAANVYGTEQLAGHQVFDHAYSAVRRIEQRANNTVSTGALRNDSYALKLNPSGAAPHYLFMTLVHCLYGEETQKQITHSLGRYVQHVLARYGSSVSTELVDPKQVTRERLQLFSQVVGTGVYITASAAENARRNATDVDDGRMPVHTRRGARHCSGGHHTSGCATAARVARTRAARWATRLVQPGLLESPERVGRLQGSMGQAASGVPRLT
jgi:hypothetical protein